MHLHFYFHSSIDISISHGWGTGGVRALYFWAHRWRGQWLVESEFSLVFLGAESNEFSSFLTIVKLVCAPRAMS
jgi:hypothetical protein